jgi:dihydrolipoamide dehydrogenase
MTRTRLALAAIFLAVIGAAFTLGIDDYLTLEEFRSRQAEIQSFVTGNFATAASAYFFTYIIVTALSIPGALVMTLIAGALFGLIAGTIIVSFASTIGATLAFLLARFLFRDFVEQRFATTAKRIATGIRKDGAYYLFTLRLVPIFPFFAINLAMALTRLKAWTFFWVSQIGMLAATIVYVNAGTQISRVESTADIASPQLIGSFVLLGLFPLITKKIIAVFTTRRRLKGYPKPKRFDANLVVIGAGAAGLVTSYIAAAAKARVILIEKDKMGGDCLNTGCVPSKALIRSASIAAGIRRAKEFGLDSGDLKVDFPKVMQRVRDVIHRIKPHDSVERYSALGVECISGHAVIDSPYRVTVNGQTITTRNIVISTGGKPLVPPIPGLESIDYLTSDNLWDLNTLPARLVILGGGPIGCEMAQAFSRLGSEVTLIEMMPRILLKEDEDVARTVTEHFEREGIRLLTGYRADSFMAGDNGTRIDCKSVNEQNTTPQELTVECDRVLVAVGRNANVTGLGIDSLGIETNPNGTLAVNEYMQTSIPNIYACGDVAGPYQLTHAGGHQGWYCAMNALFGRFWRFRIDYSALPWAVFTDPEVARVGLNEQEAAEQGVDCEVTRYGIDDLDRAIADGEASGFVKVLTRTDSDKILGVTIVGPHAGDLITEFTLAMKNGLGLKRILATIHIYPTLAEANKFAAGEWQKAHLPQRVTRLSARLLRWMRD